MAQGFYTLDEAAAQLGVSTDKVEELVRDNKLERLNAGGATRFRAKDVDALAQELGGGGPGSSKKISVLKLAPEDALDFDLTPAGGSQVGLGDLPSPSMRGPMSKGPSTGALPSGADSDLRLELENGSFEFDLSVDSDPKMEAGGPASGKLSPEGGSTGRLAKGDSQVHLDFDGPSAFGDSIRLSDKPDSSARLQDIDSLPGDDGVQTEEIDLDAEIRKDELASQARKTKVGPQGGQKTSISPPAGKGKTQIPDPGSSGLLATTSPFELSEADIDLDSSADGGGASALGGSEFELTLAPEEDVELSIDEDIDLGGSPSKSDLSNRSELSGINLHTPADSGMEIASDASDEIDFELTLDDGPGASSANSGPKTLRGKLSDLASDASEFELTLEEEQEKAKDEQDIFETDFELPAIDEDSESAAVALSEGDTDLESSDFDLAVDMDDEGDSASQVVPLDEDSLDAPTGGKTKVVGRRSGASDFDDVDELADADLEVEDDDSEVQSATMAAAPPAEWGLYPVIMMVPCVAIMLMAGLMSYEIMHGMWGYHQTTKPSGLLVRAWASLFVDPKDFPKE